MLFYGLQRYIVYGQDGVHLDFSGGQTSVEGPQNVITGVHAEIVYDAPNYADLETGAGQDLTPVKALYLTSSQVTAEKLGDVRSQMDAMGANALVLEMKNPQGVLSWNSDVQLSTSYGTNGTADLRESLAFLKEQGVYLVARISVCVDEYMALHNTPLALATTEGRVYSDSTGVWLDFSNSDVQNYTAELARSLLRLGFDEIMLANFEHPILTGDTTLAFSQQSSITLTPTIILSGFAQSLRSAVDELGGRLSVFCNTNSFRNGLSAQTGQDPVLFGKVFDRLYWTTDGSALSSDMETVTQALPRNELGTRFVPILFATGSTESWVYPIG